MSRSNLVSLALFSLLFSLTGCAGSEEPLVKEEINLHNKMATSFEKVTDEASFETCKAEIAAIGVEMKALHVKMNAAPPDRVEAARKKYENELKEAMERVRISKAKAGKIMRP